MVHIYDFDRQAFLCEFLLVQARKGLVLDNRHNLVSAI